MVGADADTVIDCDGTNAGFLSRVVNTGDSDGLGYDGIDFGGYADRAGTDAGQRMSSTGPDLPPYCSNPTHAAAAQFPETVVERRTVPAFTATLNGTAST